MENSGYLNRIINISRKHEEWRDKCINLIPSENIMSPKARELLASDFGHRYSLRDRKWIEYETENFYLGTRYIDEVYDIGCELARKLFKADYADLRPVSGHVSNLAVLMALTNIGDTIASIDFRYGGYPGIHEEGIPSKLGLKVISIPFDISIGNIDLERFKTLMEETWEVNLIYIGSSFIPFKHPIREIAEIAHRHGVLFAYDASHVLGLIAGEVYPNPIREGAVLFNGSTHKTFPGPQGGIILSIKEVEDRIRDSITMKTVDNPNYGRILALTYTLLEMIEFGKEYATQVVKNAKALAKSLHEDGIPVLYEHLGFTETHQIILDRKAFKDYNDFAKRLEAANIIVDYAARLGTAELTRRGLKESDMEVIAEYISDIYKGVKPDTIREKVVKFTERYTIDYTFK